MSSIAHLKQNQIVVATVYGRPYFKFIKILKLLHLKYDSLLPAQIKNSESRLVLTTTKEARKISSNLFLYDDAFDQDLTVIKGLIVEKLQLDSSENELIIGIDPGERIGLSVVYFQKEIQRSIFVSVEELIEHVVKILAGLKANKKIVKIGNGNMKTARQIVNLLNLKFCSHFELEFVDEHKTSPKIRNYNKRGKRDMLSARYITQRDGYRHLVLPLSRTG
ncbi:MAG: hypothetical protein ACE5JT_00475 [Nitrosopumilaceae archaeon]